MSRITVSRPTPSELVALGTDAWDSWSCGVSTFPWHYDSQETCYVLAGRVTVEAEGEKVEIGPGNLATFPAGLDCIWHVHEPIRKVYRFE
ncbi:MAG: cupin domain-containing protein [Patescibacteria group bacterium]